MLRSMSRICGNSPHLWLHAGDAT